MHESSEKNSTSLESDLKYGGRATRGPAHSSASRADDVLETGGALTADGTLEGNLCNRSRARESQIRVTKGSAMRWNAAVGEVRPHTCAIPGEIPRYYYYARPAIAWNAAKTTAARARQRQSKQCHPKTRRQAEILTVRDKKKVHRNAAGKTTTVVAAFKGRGTKRRRRFDYMFCSTQQLSAVKFKVEARPSGQIHDRTALLRFQRRPGVAAQLLVRRKPFTAASVGFLRFRLSRRNPASGSVDTT